MTAPFPPVPEPSGYGPPPAGTWGAPPPPPAPYGGYPPYGAPGYGAPGYGPPGYVPPGYGVPARLVVNPVGVVIALVGGALVLLGGFLDWYDDVVLGDIVNALDATGAKAFPKAYFGWLMWVLLAGAVVAALFANLPTGAAKALRVISPVLGALGAVLVFVSLGQLIERGSVFDHSQIGLFATLLGFVLAGVGGVIGPRRTRS